MFATTLQRFDWRNLLITKGEFTRMVAAGTVWGIVLAAGLAGLKFWNCAMLCLDDIGVTATVSVAVGILTIGPVSIYGRRG